VLKLWKPIRSGQTRSERGKPRSRGWNASSTRCGPSSLKWRLLTVYDRLLRRLANAAVKVGDFALSQRRKLRQRTEDHDDIPLSIIAEHP
jgi:hypothetical protein